MLRFPARRWLAVLLFATGTVMVFAQKPAEVPPVIVMRMEGVIAPPNAEYFSRTLRIARERGAQLLVVELDTPGGLMNSMEQIVKEMLSSEVPVAVYVSPAGAKAGSAGVFITVAAHIAAMAPGTSIGAAHPVPAGGEEMSRTMEKKVVNYAASYIRSIAEQRGRNADWAEKAVRESAAISEKQALEKRVVDMVVPNLNALLQQIDGRTVKLPQRTVTLRTREAPIQRSEMVLREKLLQVLVNPNVLAILGILALYGLIAEIQNPGAIFPGVIGAISLLLMLYGFSVLPVSWAGIALLILAVILFVADAFAPSHGVLTLGGAISMLLGLLLLFESPDPALRVSWVVALTLTGLTSLFFAFIVAAGVRAQRARRVTGMEAMAGAVAVARTDIAPRGKIFYDGAYWNAVTAGESIKAGERVVIERMDGLTAVVRKEEGSG
ncbi:MAG: nodulation protein NfeD [Armatimonadota bacterium]|nr:nodulation protein NfeD [bacterium]MCS7309421.1 nodulation protein NfeD [Armatimonadota bacterium]MDW8104562.1 nodulation protein NfeD [Armatimonadota bacterium]MDW8290170.1 nodulation protein NfeD [Armatimonadota bacterium]